MAILRFLFIGGSGLAGFIAGSIGWSLLAGVIGGGLAILGAPFGTASLVAISPLVGLIVGGWAAARVTN